MQSHEEEAEAAADSASPARHVVRQRTSSATFSPWQRRSTCTKDRAPGPAPLDASASGVSVSSQRERRGEVRALEGGWLARRPAGRQECNQLARLFAPSSRAQPQQFTAAAHEHSIRLRLQNCTLHGFVRQTNERGLTAAAGQRLNKVAAVALGLVVNLQLQQSQGEVEKGTGGGEVEGRHSSSGVHCKARCAAVQPPQRLHNEPQQAALTLAPPCSN